MTANKTNIELHWIQFVEFVTIRTIRYVFNDELPFLMKWCMEKGNSRVTI
jgi:hypothetical protein